MNTLKTCRIPALIIATSVAVLVIGWFAVPFWFWCVEAVVLTAAVVRVLIAVRSLRQMSTECAAGENEGKP